MSSLEEPERQPQQKQPIVVVGAGVLGLSAATLLQEKYPMRSVTIVAAEFPGQSPMHMRDGKSRDAASRPSADYASMWAGAHYRPIPGSTRQLNEEAQLAYVTAKKMKHIAASEQGEVEAGVRIVKGVEYLEDPPEANLVLKSGDMYAGEDDEFRILTKDKLPQGVEWGCEYMAYVVNVHIYCLWLLRQFVKKGGCAVEKRLKCLDDAFQMGGDDKMPLVVNCSGRNFDTDPRMQVIRGQTVLVRNEFNKTVTRQNMDGSWSFLIPRPSSGGTIVGGTKEIGDMNIEPRKESRQLLLENAVKYFPEFVDDVQKFDVVMDNVGRRPWREGGLRIEAEELGQGRKVVHGYGGGGRGYELSWGAAEKMLLLVDACLASETKH